MNRLLGQQIEQYQIESFIGKGSLGAVYRALDVNLNRPVALKLIDPALIEQPDVTQTFMREARAASRLVHPGIVPLYNFGRQNGRFYIVTAHIDGASLDRVLAYLAQQHQVLRLNESLHLVAQAADALGFAHQEGVWHRGMKPGNILVKLLDKPIHAGEPRLKAMVADFGFSPVPETGLQQTSLPSHLGSSLPYLSPEQCMGRRLDGRTDIYSLGVILYQLIAGQLPFTIHNSNEALMRHTLENPLSLGQLRPGVPADVLRIVEKAMAKKPKERFQLAEQMADALRQTAAMLTAADTVLFAPQEQVTSLVVLLESGVPLENSVTAATTAPVESAEETVEETAVNTTTSDVLPPLAQTGLNGRSQPEPAPPPVQSTDPPIEVTEQKSTPPQPAPDDGSAWATEPSLSPPQLGDQVIITRQGRHPRRFSLNKSPVLIGRARDNDIVLESLDVSRYHARLEKHEGGWQIMDLKSRGGTFSQNKKLTPDTPEPWAPDQPLRIGPYFLHWQQNSKTMPPAEAEATEGEAPTELFNLPAEGSQAQSEAGNFRVAMTPTLLKLGPGEGTAVQVEFFNQGPAPLSLRLTLSGAPAGAVTYSREPVRLTPGARASVPVTFRVPPAGEMPFDQMPAGIYPFQLRVRETGNEGDSAVLSGQFTIAPVSQFAIGLWPTELDHGRPCRVLIRNEGNVTANYTLAGRDPANVLRFSGQQGRVRLEPGEAQTRTVTITHEKRPFLGRSRQFPFEIEVRDSSGEVQSKTGHMSLRPRLPAWVLPLLEIVLVVALTGVVIVNLLNNRPGAAIEGTPTGLLSDSENPLATAAATDSPALTVEQLQGDEDVDQLTGAEERSLGTDPNSADTDGDGIADGDEINLYGTNPTLADTDGDGLLDGSEINVHGTDPTLADTDLDGVSDGEEVEAGTDPLRPPIVTQPPPATAVSPTNPPATNPTNTPGTGATGPTDSTDTPDATTSATNTPPSDGDTIQTQLTYLADESGWVNDLGEAGTGADNPPQAGDRENGEERRAFLVFDVSQLPANATIQSARLLLAGAETEGAPFVELSCLLVEAIEFEPPLGISAYDVGGFFISCESGPPVALDVTVDVQDAVDFGLERLQIRFSFEESPNSDSVTDLYVIRTAPTLEVEYVTP